MGSFWKVSGYMALGAWLVVMVFPVFNGKTNGFSALVNGPAVASGGFPARVDFFGESLLATLLLLGWVAFAFFMANRSSK